LRGDVLSGAMQPTGEYGTVRELRGIFSERDKGALRHILRQVRIANHPQRGGINKVNVPADQFGKCRF